nr:MAG TPA: hypothetical protein [Caudoviricetes sp.]
MHFRENDSLKFFFVLCIRCSARAPAGGFL